MAEQQTTTDQDEDKGAQEAQPEDTSTTDAAVTTAADEPETTDQPEESESSTNEETEEPDKDDSDEVVEWARKKGLPLSEEPTDNELKLAKMQRDAERKMHDTTRKSSELEDAVGEQIDDAISQNPDISQSDARMAKIEAEIAVEKFFRSNPDASQHEAKMAELVRENPARARLPLNDLYELARSRSGANEEAESNGGRKALEGLARKQKAAAPKGNAVSSNTSGNKVTREAISDAIKRGDDAWLKENNDEINRRTADGTL